MGARYCPACQGVKTKGAWPPGDAVADVDGQGQELAK